MNELEDTADAAVDEDDATPQEEMRGRKCNIPKWPGVMRGFGPITRLCEWEWEERNR